MKTIVVKQFFFGLIGLNLFTLLIFFLNGGAFSADNHRELPAIQIEQFQQPKYSFTDPKLAFQILTQLEINDDNHPNSGFGSGRKNLFPYMNLTNDDEYCAKRRAFVIENPMSLFEEMNFVSDLYNTSTVRSKLLTKIGNDVQPYIGSHNKAPTMHKLDPSVSNFYTRMSMFRDKVIGKHFGCVSQISNQIPGEQALDIKYKFTEAVIKYSEQYQDRPQCFSFNKFFPKTYMLYKKDSCQEFFQEFNSPRYQEMKNKQDIVYIKKIGRGAHMGAGVDLVNDEEEANLRTLYANGTKCGTISDLFLVQNYIPNPLLIYGRKFDFRSYMLIASTDPLIAYYHDGTLRVSLMPYDTASNDKKTLLTNIALNKDIYAEAKEGKLYQGMGENELKLEQQWTFSRFQEYMLESGVVKDPAWFDGYLRPQFKKAMIHLLRFGLVSPYQKSTVYQHYGMDFMLDTDMHLWFLEANSAPGMERFSEPVEKFVMKMLEDEMEIVMGLLRSRMKRVIDFVNTMIEDGSVKVDQEGNAIITDIETARMKFDKITKNYFEEEFKPSPTNGFSKIIDGNLKGADMYYGFLGEECI